jgi:ankyrin repeat protein
MKPRKGITFSALVLAVALLSGAIGPRERELLDAARRGDIVAVRSALKDGADVNAAQGDGLTALHMAAESGNVEVAKALLGAGAKVAATTRIGAYTPLHIASAGAHTAVVEALIAGGADVAAVSSPAGSTPLHLAAKALNGEGAVRVLLAHAAPVNARESSAGQTPLMFAASLGRTAAVKELLSKGADPSITTEAVDVMKRLVIDQAAQGSLRAAADSIRQTLPDGTAMTPTQVQAAIDAQRRYITNQAEIEKLFRNYKPEQLARKGIYPGTDVEYLRWPIWQRAVGRTGGLTALLHAAREGHIETVAALLDGGAGIDQVSAGDGSSPLLMATQNGHFDLAMMLLQRGANPNLAALTDGVAPLFSVIQTQWSNFTSHPQPRAHDLAKTGYMELVEALLKAGADPNMRITAHLWYWEFGDRAGIDIAGATPFWRAAYADDLELMKLLAQHGADPNIPTRWNEVGMRAGRQEDGRAGDDSGLPPIPEGSPNNYPIHAAAGGGWIGFIAIDQNQVPNNFLNVVKWLVEEQGADVNVQNSWGYAPLHYAAARGDIAMIDYLVSKGANLNPVSRLGQTPTDFARGGGAGFHYRSPQPAALQHLVDLGGEYRCLHTHFRGTGTWCEGSGVPLFEGVVKPVEDPTPPKGSKVNVKRGT